MARASKKSAGNDAQAETYISLLSDAVEHNSYKPTEKQFDKMLDIRLKDMEYDYEQTLDITKLARDKQRNSFIFRILIFSFVLVTALVVIVFRPEYTSEVLAAIVALLGGYGFGRMESSPDLPSSSKKS